MCPPPCSLGGNVSVCVPLSFVIHVSGRPIESTKPYDYTNSIHSIMRGQVGVQCLSVSNTGVSKLAYFIRTPAQFLLIYFSLMMEDHYKVDLCFIVFLNFFFIIYLFIYL